MDALKEIGFRKSYRYLLQGVVMLLFRVLCYSPLRVVFLRIMGAHIGKNCVIHNIRFFNWYRGSFKNVVLRDNVFLGDECLLDLADKITFENHVTLGERVVVLTHMNVGFKNHPLQKFFPPIQKATLFSEGSFIGSSSTIIAGSHIGPRTFIAAGSVVTKDIAGGVLAGGVPAKVLRPLT